MKNTILPIIRVSTEPPARKQSASNLDALFSAVTLFLNLHEVAVLTADLIGILSSMHNILISRLDHDALRTINLYKNLASWFVSYLRGVKLANNGKFSAYDWDQATNVPLVFVALVPFFDKLHSTSSIHPDSLWRFKQAVYCYLSGHRVIITPARIDYTTITAPSTVASVPSFITQLPEALARLGISPELFSEKFNAECASAKFSVVTTAGPNGQATWSAHEDAIAITSSSELMGCLFRYAQLSNLTWIIAAMMGCVEAPKELSGSKNGDFVAGRIHPIEEWGGKTRLVAILDYWTQALLTPLHNTIFHFLRQLPEDGTFDQLAIISKVQEWTADPNRSVYSYDLTAATDRIPISFQRDILAYLLSSDELADNWMSIMRDRDFLAPDGSKLRYAVGQPMGAKSSFGMLGLCHHVIVQIAAMNAKVDNYKDYVVLGDDNTQANSQVATCYIHIMGSLGVPINQEKSIVPSVGLKSAAEICKRIFIEGRELTALPAKLIVKCTKFGYMASGLQNVLFERGQPVLPSHVIPFIAGLVDQKSLLGIILLNKVPLSVSGLKYNVPVAAALDYSKWFLNLQVTDQGLENAFMFSLVTEQLKRVDALLRGTLQMNEIIMSAATGIPAEHWPPSFFIGLSDDERDALIAKLPSLGPNHPIVAASKDELDRVVSYLSGLRAGSPEMVSAARRGLLDLLRNSLHEIWLSDSERKATIQRTIFNVMLSTLTRLQRQVAARQPATLNFSILLTSVGRMWSVNFAYPNPVHINVVKSRVDASVTGVHNKITKTLEQLDLTTIRI